MEGLTFVFADGRSEIFYKLDEIRKYYGIAFKYYRQILEQINTGVHRRSELEDTYGAKTSASIKQCPGHIWLLNEDAIEELLFLTSDYSSLQQLQFEDHVFYYTIDNLTQEYWFHATKFAKTLMFSRTKQAIREHVDEDCIKRFGEISYDDVSQLSYHPSLLFINRTGCKQLLLHSNMPRAQEIQRWLNEDARIQNSEVLVTGMNDILDQLSTSTINQEGKIKDLEAKLTKAELEKKVAEQERDVAINRAIMADARTRVAELQNKLKFKSTLENLRDRQNRSVNEFKYNKQLEHYCYWIVKDKTLKKYDEKIGRYYIPGNKGLQTKMSKKNLRFYTIRGQKRYCVVRLRKLLKKFNGAAELVHIHKGPDPINGLNLLNKELNEIDRNAAFSPTARNVDAFTQLKDSSSSPLYYRKVGVHIDFNKNLYFDDNKQKKITDYYSCDKENYYSMNSEE